jgi:beta-N-acetylhexosaminidase
MPAVEEDMKRRHGFRRGVIAATAAVVLVSGAVAADYYANHHGNVAAHHNPSETAQSVQVGETLTPKPPTQAECIAKLPLALKLAQKLMISADANTVDSVSAVAAKYNLGGIILMGPVPSSAQTHSLQSAQKYPLLIATDQEGGTVERYKTGGTLPAAADVPGLWTPVQAEAHAKQSELYLKSQGVNMNLAPLADVAPAGGSSVLGSRIFSSSPSVVATYDKAYVAAGLDTGVLPTLKHFPGLGGATRNTDYGPASSPAMLTPYKLQGGTKAAVMVGNQTVPGISGGTPASLSRNVITDLLRGQLGYKNNVVITDSLSAAAITSRGTITNAAVEAWGAGADISLTVSYGSGLTAEQQVQQILAAGKAAVAAGRLSESEVNASVARLWTLPQKHIDACKLTH